MLHYALSYQIKSGQESIEIAIITVTGALLTHNAPLHPEKLYRVVPDLICCLYSVMPVEMVFSIILKKWWMLGMHFEEHITIIVIICMSWTMTREI